MPAHTWASRDSNFYITISGYFHDCVSYDRMPTHACHWSRFFRNLFRMFSFKSCTLLVIDYRTADFPFMCTMTQNNNKHFIISVDHKTQGWLDWWFWLSVFLKSLVNIECYQSSGHQELWLELQGPCLCTRLLTWCGMLAGGLLFSSCKGMRIREEARWNYVFRLGFTSQMIILMPYFIC